MPKTVMRLYLGEEHDKEAQEYLKRTIDFEEMAARAATPSDRERYGDKARLERSLAIEALEQAAIASGSELRELIRETRNSSRLLAFLHLIRTGSVRSGVSTRRCRSLYPAAYAAHLKCHGGPQ